MDLEKSEARSELLRSPQQVVDLPLQNVSKHLYQKKNTVEE